MSFWQIFRRVNRLRPLSHPRSHITLIDLERMYNISIHSLLFINALFIHLHSSSLIRGFFSIFRYVFSAPGQLLESMPGTLMLTDCLEACQSNDTCGSVNYETGLCVLFSSNADKLPGL